MITSWFIGPPLKYIITMTTASTSSTLINPLQFLQLVLVFCSSSLQKNSSLKQSKTVNMDKDTKTPANSPRAA